MNADSFERPARERRVGACLLVAAVALGAACSGERVGADANRRATEATAASERPTSGSEAEPPQASPPAGPAVIWSGSAAGLLQKAGPYRFVLATPGAERQLRRALYDMQSGGLRISDMTVRSVLDARTGEMPGIGAIAGVMKASNPLGPDAMALLAIVMTESTTDIRLKLAGRPAFLFENATESKLVLFPADNAFIVLNSLDISKVLRVGAALGRVFEDLPVEV